MRGLDDGTTTVAGKIIPLVNPDSEPAVWVTHLGALLNLDVMAGESEEIDN